MDPFAFLIVPSISVQDLHQAIENDGSFILLDVRTPGEFARGKIKGSTNIPVDRIEIEVESQFPDKNATIFVYCLSGSRSVYAVSVMKRIGYTNVYDVKQGLLAWRAHYFPVEN